MAKPDLLLSEERVSVISGDGPATTDGTERGDLELKPDQDADPRVAMNADRSNIVLGGGRDGPAGIRLDGQPVDRNPDNYEATGTKIGVYTDFGTGAPIVDTVADIAGLDFDDSAGIELGNAADITPGSPPDSPTDGALVLNESGVPGTMIGGASMRLGNDEVPGTIDVRGGEGASLSMDGGGGTTIDLQPDRGAVTAGGPGATGTIIIRDRNAETVGFLEAKDGTLTLCGPDRTTAIEIEAGGTVSFPNMTDGDWRNELPL